MTVLLVMLGCSCFACVTPSLQISMCKSSRKNGLNQPSRTPWGTSLRPSPSSSRSSTRSMLGCRPVASTQRMRCVGSFSRAFRVSIRSRLMQSKSSTRHPVPTLSSILEHQQYRLKAAIPQFLLSLRLVIFLRCPSTSMTCGAAFSKLARSANASLALVLQEALFKCTKTMKKSSKKARPTGSVTRLLNSHENYSRS